MISSGSNPQIKYLIQLQKKAKLRDQDSVFVIEGRKMFEEVLQYKSKSLVKTYINESFYNAMIVEDSPYFDALSFEVITDSCFREVTETVTPQGILAIVKKPCYRLSDILVSGRLRLLILENLRDPGNLGTIVRTAEGAGMNGIILSRESVDLFNPKVIRSTMGSVLRVPFFYADDFSGMLSELKQAGVSLYAAYLQGSEEFDQIIYKERTALLIGNEANGLTQESAAASDYRIRIPMEGHVESLNAAVAAALIMYQAR